MAKLTWNNLNRFQRNFVTKEAKVFAEIENNPKLSEEQKDVLFLDNYNLLIKADYSSYKFPSSIPTPGLGIPKAAKTKAKAPAKAKKEKKAPAAKGAKK